MPGITCDEHGNELFRGELLLSEADAALLAERLQGTRYRFEPVPVLSGLRLMTSNKRKRVTNVGNSQGPVHAGGAMHAGGASSGKLHVLPVPPVASVPAPLGWHRELNSLVTTLLAEPDVRHWLSSRVLPEAVSGISELPDSLGDIAASIPATQSHFDFQERMAGLVDWVLRSAPLNHPLFLVAWKTRRLTLELLKQVTPRIANEVYYSVAIPDLPPPSSPGLLPEKVSAGKARTVSHEPASRGSGVSRQSGTADQAALLARIQALESQVHSLSGGAAENVQVVARPMSVAEIEKLESDIGKLSDTVLAQMVQEKLKNSSGLRWEGTNEDRAAVIDVGAMDPKTQRALRRWVSHQLRPKQTRGQERRQDKEARARGLEEEVERMIKRKREAREIAALGHQELQELQHYREQQQQAEHYMNLMALDHDEGLDALD